MSNDMKDILDLCRLNLMEEHVTDSSAVDRELTLKAIDYKKRVLVGRITNTTKPASPEILKRHLKQQI